MQQRLSPVWASSWDHQAARIGLRAAADQPPCMRQHLPIHLPGKLALVHFCAAESAAPGHPANNPPPGVYPRVHPQVLELPEAGKEELQAAWKQWVQEAGERRSCAVCAAGPQQRLLVPQSLLLLQLWNAGAYSEQAGGFAQLGQRRRCGAPALRAVLAVPTPAAPLPAADAVNETGAIPPGNAPGQTLWQQRRWAGRRSRACMLCPDRLLQLSPACSADSLRQCFCLLFRPLATCMNSAAARGRHRRLCPLGFQAAAPTVMRPPLPRFSDAYQTACYTVRSPAAGPASPSPRSG